MTRQCLFLCLCTLDRSLRRLCYKFHHLQFLTGGGQGPLIQEVAMAIEFIAWALKQDFPSGPKFVLVALANRANQDGECWPSQKDLAKQTSTTDRSVRRHLDWLVSNGIITKSRRRRRDGSYTSDLFKINTCSVPKKDKRTDCPSENLAAGQSVQTPPEKLSGHEPSPVLTSVNTESSKTRTRTKSSQTLSDFQIWYERYPHKVGVGAAEKAFRKAIRNSTLTELLEGLDRYIQTKPPGRQWCNPSTWLNEKRWLDQPQEVKPHDPHPQISNPKNNAQRADDALQEVLAEYGIDENSTDSTFHPSVFRHSGHLRSYTRTIEKQDAGYD
jgi:DNA-binding transcriptional ArsR family regulator